MADRDHVVVRIEMNALAAARAFVAGDEVPARMRGRIAPRPLGTDQIDAKARPPEPVGKILADLEIVQPRRIECRDPDQIPGEADKIVAPCGDLVGDALVEGCGHGARLSPPRGFGNADRHGSIAG
ncbi:hypothetical protein [Albidovulum sp.]|uniref:hypothetical protein n=1 Tax=Albidovulum sp. TaxID=1872424 RepID=UPI003527C80E